MINEYSYKQAKVDSVGSMLPVTGWQFLEKVDRFCDLLLISVTVYRRRQVAREDGC